jgi:hypothetical protein
MIVLFFSVPNSKTLVPLAFSKLKKVKNTIYGEVINGLWNMSFNKLKNTMKCDNYKIIENVKFEKEIEIKNTNDYNEAIEKAFEQI